nr:hypothetical protein [Tanacetum cinerariifolium]
LWVENVRKRRTFIQKEIVFTKGDISPYGVSTDVTSNAEFEDENQQPLPPLLKLSRVVPIEPSVKGVKKRTQTLSPFVPSFDQSSTKKADSYIKEILLTLMKEVKGLNNQITSPSENQGLLLSDPMNLLKVRDSLAYLKLSLGSLIYSVWNRVDMLYRAMWDTMYWGFLEVSHGYDVLVFWIRHIELYPFVVFGECRHGYVVTSLMDTAYWSSE